MSKMLVFFTILSVLDIVNSARILAVFPAPSISHQVVFRVLTLELVKRGHEIDVITTDPAFSKEEAPPNLTEIDIHDLSYNYSREFMIKEVAKHGIGKDSEWLAQIDSFFYFFSAIIEIQLKSDQMRNFFQEKKQYDLLIVEALVRPVLIFSHFFKAPVIQVSSFGAMLENLEAVGAPTHPLLYPIPFRQRLYNLTFWEKLREQYHHLRLAYALRSSLRKEDEMLQRIFGPNIPSLNNLVNNIDMLFLNVHPIWMDNIPVPSNVIFMGGLHQKPFKELPQDLKSYLDLSKNGVVYVSFGTNVHPQMFTPERLKVLIETLSELPYDVLFKWNDDVLPGKTDNIRISKWLPQSDLLRHPNIKAFVMQGGLQSTDEAITAGVPLICIPMFGDQWYNAEKYVKMKIGIKLDFFTLTKSELKNAIDTIISDKSYRENIANLRNQMNDQPQTPLERAVWWVEYVLRHKGAKHLRAPAANMSIAEYYELELVLIVLLTLLVVSIAIVSFLRFVRNAYNGMNDKLKTS